MSLILDYEASSNFVDQSNSSLELDLFLLQLTSEQDSKARKTDEKEAYLLFVDFMTAFCQIIVLEIVISGLNLKFADFLYSIDPLMVQLFFSIYHIDKFKILTLGESQKKDSRSACQILKYSKKASINFENLVARQAQ